MTTRTKLALGAFLAVFGGLGMVLGSAAGFAAFPGPWDFIAGFVIGVVAGLGAALAVAGLLESRRN